ncbi:MAG: MFS transporter [Clostridiales bacterium]|nr:MFS transporter [Clostridiales bacterium]
MSERGKKIGDALKRAVGVEGSFKEAILPMLGYNSASILFGGSGYIISLYFISFLTEVEGLNVRQAGLVMFFAQIWDAVTDPAMGIITDRTRSKYGRHRRYLLWGVIPIALSYFMMWNSFGISSIGNPTLTMIYYIGAYMFFNGAYTLVCVPHTAMLPELAPEYFLRTQYKSIEYIMNSVGMVSSFILVSFSLGFSDMEILNSGMRLKFMILGLILCLWFSLPLLITFKTTREPSSLDMELPELNVKELMTEYKYVFKNKSFREYFVISLFYMMARGFYNNSNQYFIRYIAQRQERYNIIMTVAGVAEASTFPLNFWLTKKFGKQKCGLLLAPVMIVGILLNLLITPTSGTFGTVLLFVAVILYYVGYAGIGFVSTNIQPDVTDVDELITGRRREGLIGTFNSLIKKTVNGFMSAFTGFILSAFDFKTGKGTLDQTAKGILGLRITYIVIPVICTVISFISIFKYKMNKSDHEMIKAVISEKKKNGFVTVGDDDKKTLESIAGMKYEDMWISSPDIKNFCETIENDQ